MRRVCMMILAVGTTAISAQQPSVPPTSSAGNLQQTTLQFTAKVKEPLTLPSHAMIDFPACGASGAVFFRFVMPPSYVQQELYAVSPKGEVRNFSFGNIPGLSNATLLSFDASNSETYALLSAQPGNAVASHIPGAPGSQPEDGARQHPSKLFLATFDLDGKYVDAVPLDLPFRPIRIAALGEDSLVVLGIETTTARPVLALLDSHGNSLRPLESEDAISPADTILHSSKRGEAMLESIPGPGRLRAALSRFSFVHYRGSLLLLEPGSKPKVTEISVGGQFRTVQLHLPPGFDADSLLSSDRYWLLRVLPVDEAEKHPEGSKEDWGLFQFDPDTGDFLRKINAGDLAASDIVCAHDGEFLAFQWVDGKAHLMAANP
jgi:hypothetical protein